MSYIVLANIDAKTTRAIAALAPKGCVILADGHPTSDGCNHEIYGLWHAQTAGKVKRIKLGVRAKVFKKK